ncbi:MAG: helix-turn-helix domain-containing protein [Bacteroidota bacterium]
MAKEGKNRILEASFRLFLQKGYKGVSMKDIQEATALSKGAIYHHFASKYDIYLAVMENHLLALLKQAAGGEHQELSFEDQIRARYQLLISLMDYVEEITEEGYPIRNYFLFQLEGERDGAIRQQIQGAMDMYRQGSHTLVKDAQQKGHIRADISAHIIAQQLMGMIEGLAIHHSSLEKNSKEFLTTTYEEVIGSYLKLIKA